MKILVLTVLLLAVFTVGGRFGYQRYQAEHARVALMVAQASEAAHRTLTEQQAQEFNKKKVADDAMRQEIDAALRPLKVSSIMPGQPGMAIIDKQEYTEGDQLALPKGRKVRITKVQENGVLLAYNDLTFRLDPPAAPDLSASRKRR